MHQVISDIYNKICSLIINTYDMTLPRCLVLIYHRVSDLKHDPQLLSVSPRRFENQLKYLKNNYNIISLKQLISNLRNGSLDKRSIVITFDDGYSDNLYNAKLLLEKYHIPATFFITSGTVGNKTEFWWDMLEVIFLEKVHKKKILSIDILNKQYTWVLDSDIRKKAAYDDMVSLLKTVPIKERTRIMKYLIEWAGVRNKVRPEYFPLSERELKKLSSGDFVEIGAHTVTHCMLSLESIEHQHWEINESKRSLESLLNIKMESFSYPYGNDGSFTDETIDIVKESGFSCGISNIQDVVISSTDIYKIPRFLIRNWDINRFKNEIAGAMGDNRDDILYVINKRLFSGFYAKYFYWKKLCGAIKNYHVNNTKTSSRLSNVLQINAFDNIGGAAKVSYCLHEKLLKHKYKSYILVNTALQEDNNISVIEKNIGVKQKLLNYQQSRLSWLDFFHLSSFDIKNYDCFINSDVVHYHNLHGGYFNPFALPELTAMKPSIWTLHDMQAFTGHCAHSFNCDLWMRGCNKCEYLDMYPSIDRDAAAFLLYNKKRIYDSSRFDIVCPSNWLKSKVEKSILQNHTIRLIYNGIDHNIYKDADKKITRKKLKLPLERKIIIFSSAGGKDNIYKGGNYLIEAYKALSKRKDLLFINIGGTKTDSFGDNWIDVSFINDEKVMASYYAAADLFIYPSLADNCPLVVLESLSCGTPVVSFNTGGIPELIDHLETGYLAEYKNINDLLQGLYYFLNDNKRLSRASKVAREMILKKFTLDIMYDKYHDAYCDVFEKYHQIQYNQ